MRIIAEARVSAGLLAILVALAIGCPAKVQAQTTTQACTDNAAAVAACAAYESAAHGALQPYYKLVNAGKLRHKYVSNLFDAAYSPAAQTTIMLWAINKGHSINSWPTGTNDVRGPTIEVSRVVPHPACGRTLLVTRETWQVTGTNNQVLYSEYRQIHTVVLDRNYTQVLFLAKGKHLTLAGC